MALKDGSKETRGGARPNSGPKKTTKVYSDAIKRDFLRAAKRKAKETGKTLGDIVMDIAYGPYHQDAVRIAAVKCFNEVVVIKESHKTVEKTEAGVVQYPSEELPEEVATPATVLQ
jgi:hypothetical protein